MLKNIIKTSLVVVGTTTVAVPTAAFAYSSGTPDWSADTMLSNGASDAGMSITNVDSGGVNTWVIGIAKWLAGLATVCFVLKVVMTAVDRMVLGNTNDGMPQRGGQRNQQSSGFRLSDIPLIGAYQPDVSWKQVWLNFAKNLAIVVGVYVIISLIMGVIMWLIGVGTMENVS